jgi:hypothetical protein
LATQLTDQDNHEIDSEPNFSGIMVYPRECPQYVAAYGFIEPNVSGSTVVAETESEVHLAGALVPYGWFQVSNLPHWRQMSGPTVTLSRPSSVAITRAET